MGHTLVKLLYPKQWPPFANGHMWKPSSAFANTCSAVRNYSSGGHRRSPLWLATDALCCAVQPQSHVAKRPWKSCIQGCGYMTYCSVPPKGLCHAGPILDTVRLWLHRSHCQTTDVYLGLKLHRSSAVTCQAPSRRPVVQSYLSIIPNQQNS